MAEPRGRWPDMGMSLKYQATIYGFGSLLGLIGKSSSNYWPVSFYALAMVIGYVASLKWHPQRNCWHCRGTGKHYGYIWNYARRFCEGCDGTGRRLRLGARLFGIDENGNRRK